MALNNSRGVRVIMDPGALQSFISSPQGPIVKSLIRRGTLVQNAAKLQIRLGHVGGGEKGVKGALGNLRNTIVKRTLPPDGTTQAPFVRVGSAHPIALIHHNGTRPHIIRPRKAKMLRFYSQKGGAFVFRSVVHHPGTRPNRYLTDNLHLATR